LAGRISYQIAGAIDNARLHSNLENAAEEREVLAEIGRVISSSIEIGKVYESFAHQVGRLLQFDRLAITTVDTDLDQISHPYVSGVRIPGWEPGEFQPYEGSATKKIIDERKGLLLLDGDGDASDSASSYPSLRVAESSGLRSYMAVPLYASNQPVGTLTLRSKRPDAYTQTSLELAYRIGDQIAGAIANAQLFARINTAQEELETSERRYRTLVESGSDVVFTADETGNFSFVAPAVKRLTGYTPDELRGKHFTFLIHKDQVNDTRKFYSRQFKEQELETTYQFPITTKSGETRWVEQRVTLLKPAENAPNFHGVVRDITDRRAAEEAEFQRSAAEARAEALRRTSQRVVTAQETLRRDIARQLHGSIQNRLILLSHRLESARVKVSDEEANKDIKDILEDLQTILEKDMRNISRRLYPSILRQGIVPAIQTLTDQIESIVPIKLHIDEELVRQERTDRRLTPEPVRLAIFRIAEEALTNIAKHAKASTVEVELRLVKDRNSLRIMVRDDGQGFDLSNTKHSVGLVGMEDYANTMNGEYNIRTAPGAGTLVEATLPIAVTEESTEPTISP
jgi:PAS domain S-box-containing protein